MFGFKKNAATQPKNAPVSLPKSFVQEAYDAYKEEGKRISMMYEQLDYDGTDEIWKGHPRYRIDVSVLSGVDLFVGTASHEYALDPMSYFRNQTRNDFAGMEVMHTMFDKAMLDKYMKYLQTFEVEFKPYYLKISNHKTYHGAVAAMNWHIADSKLGENFPLEFDGDGNPMP